MTRTNSSNHVCLKCRRRLCLKWQQTSSDHVLMKRGISLCPKSWQRNSSDHVGTGGRLNKPWNLTLHYLLFGGALEPQSYTSPGTFTLFFGWRNPGSPEVHKPRNLTLDFFFFPRNPWNPDSLHIYCNWTLQRAVPGTRRNPTLQIFIFFGFPAEFRNSSVGTPNCYTVGEKRQRKSSTKRNKVVLYPAWNK